MNAGDASASDDRPSDERSHGIPGQTPTGAAHADSRTTWLLVLAAMMAALVSWGVGETFYDVIPAQRVSQNLMGTMIMAPNMATESVATVRNGALTFGISGLCVAGFLGVAGGLARRSIPAMIAAGLPGAILGFILAAGLCLALIPKILDARDQYLEYELAILFAMHGVIWGFIGALAAFAFAIGLGQRRFMIRALLSGFVGAVMASILYGLIGAAVFPLAETSQPVSHSWKTRLLAQFLLAGMTALFLAVAARDGRRDRRAATVVGARGAKP